MDGAAVRVSEGGRVAPPGVLQTELETQTIVSRRLLCTESHNPIRYALQDPVEPCPASEFEGSMIENRV